MSNHKTFPVVSSFAFALVALVLLLLSLDSMPIQAQESAHIAAFGTDVSLPAVTTATLTNYTPSWITNATPNWRIADDVQLPNQVSSTPHNPIPANNAFNVPITQTCHWEMDNEDGVLGYNIALGTTDPPPVVGTTYAGETSYTPPTPLADDTAYYWGITVVYDDFSSNPGPTWRFTTTVELPPNQPPNTPTVPVPADGASNTPTDQELGWQGGDPDGDDVTYTVALGTANPPPVVATITQTNFAPPTDLISGTVYYWRITAADGISDSVGATWHFTTILPTGPISIYTGTGGTVTSDDGSAQAQFPGNAITTTTIITATTAVTTPNSISDYQFIGRVYDITAADTNGSPVTYFNQPFTMTLFYNDSDWQNAGITNESDLNVYWWDGNAWVGMLPCTGCFHDLVYNQFLLRLDHLTEFTIMKSEKYYIYLPLIIKN